jgi:oxygen-independent coproporphyrinogen-3 oxidase
VTPFSLYIHIPYCDSKCPYCDFNSYAAKRWPEADYCAALIRELEGYAAEPAWREGELRSVFFGGGTPSLFDPASIGGLLSAVTRLWPRQGEPVEITLEANPGTVDRAKLAGFRAAGVNRISFGVQSFHPRHLERLGRIHSAAQAIAAIGLAREAGFTNLNFDLIFAVPGQTVEEWEADLEMAVALAPDHISAYSLTYEDGTVFGAQRRSGRIVPVPEEVEVAMFARTQVRLAEAGFAHYEISNYARPGRECRHNLNYWHTGPYASS